MTDHKDNNHIDPTLLDTQRLLLGVDLPEDVPFDLEDILAEYGGGHTDAPPPEEPQAPERRPGNPPPHPCRPGKRISPLPSQSRSQNRNRSLRLGRSRTRMFWTWPSGTILPQRRAFA